MAKLFRAICIVIELFIVAGFSSCHDEHKHFDYATNTKHTILIYMVGDDGTMNKFVTPNIEHILNGLRESPTPPNVVIYHDCNIAKDNLPVLFQLKLREDHSRIDTIYLKKWKADLDSTDPAHIAAVTKLAFSKCKSQVKGFEYWGHGLSWIPGNKFHIAEAAPTRAMEYVGADNGNKCDIWELRAALEGTGLHFDYMIFDACNMATAEVAYEFRHLTDFILAAPTEVMGAGFPYRKTIPALSIIKDEQSIIDGLTSAFEGFKDEYINAGSLSLISTQHLDQLYDACRRFKSNASQALALWENAPTNYVWMVQNYGRPQGGSTYYFYDLQDWADQLCLLDNDLDDGEIKVALDLCVLKEFHANYFYDGYYKDAINRFPMNRCCGLGMSIPQFWGINKKNEEKERLNAAYTKLQWQL